jgi:hypothetical protein
MAYLQRVVQNGAWSTIKRWINDSTVALLNVERRIDPYFRNGFDRMFQRPLVTLTQAAINFRRPDDGLGIAKERPLAGEETFTREIVETMGAFLRKTYPHGGAERAGNTKTYGVVRADFTVLPNLPEALRHGVFAEPQTYHAWVRFGGPGPLTPPDMKDNGILSIGIKLLGVPGPKLLDDERWTQDFTGISAPTFTTPNVRENSKLQRQLLAGWPILYFLNPFDSHYRDALMQGLYARTHSSPLEARYWSCVPYLFGDGQAMQYSIVPRSRERTKIPGRPSPNYLREAMARTLRERDVEFDFLIQLQTDPYRMPVENASVIWPERLSPFVAAARLRVPAQRFDSPAQLAFAHNLSFNPWHAIPAHRPLGNQNRARRMIYLELSKLRQAINGEARIEPTGDERFDDGDASYY